MERVKLFIQAIHFVTPWVLRSFGMMFLSISITVSSLIRSIPVAIDGFGKKVVDLATYPYTSKWDKLLYWLSCSVAVLELMLCWVAISYLTVFLVNLLYGAATLDF